MFHDVKTLILYSPVDFVERGGNRENMSYLLYEDKQILMIENILERNNKYMKSRRNVQYGTIWPIVKGRGK